MIQINDRVKILKANENGKFFIGKNGTVIKLNQGCPTINFDLGEYEETCQFYPEQVVKI